MDMGIGEGLAALFASEGAGAAGAGAAGAGTAGATAAGTGAIGTAAGTGLTAAGAPIAAPELGPLAGADVTGYGWMGRSAIPPGTTPAASSTASTSLPWMQAAMAGGMIPKLTPMRSPSVPGLPPTGPPVPFSTAMTPVQAPPRPTLGGSGGMNLQQLQMLLQVLGGR